MYDLTNSNLSKQVYKSDYTLQAQQLKESKIFPSHKMVPSVVPRYDKIYKLISSVISKT